ncbi:MAG: 30S ribosomal protein S16 [Bacteroidales bacterium]|jgi:small subunit ribosomal protein S16|nr:30S ribosomal protein S16 [Bacteroidales bacterium]
MPVKIRLQRRGKKGQPFYHVVIADGRAPRDGKFIEKIGTYDPLTHPATITLDVDRAYHWITCGAQPTDTARMILKREGVYLKKHLVGGVQKGALTEEQAEEKLAAWKEEKARKLSDMKSEVINSKRSMMKKRLEAETKIKEAKAAIVNEKRQAVLAAEAAKRAEAEAIAAAAAQKDLPATQTDDAVAEESQDTAPETTAQSNNDVASDNNTVTSEETPANE